MHTMVERVYCLIVCYTIISFSTKIGFVCSYSHRYQILQQHSLRNKKYSKLRVVTAITAANNFIILGGSGDLSSSKIVPSLFDLFKQYSIGEGIRNEGTRSALVNELLSTKTTLSKFDFSDFSIKLVGRSMWSDDSIRGKISVTLPPIVLTSTSIERMHHEKKVAEFLSKCFYTCVKSYDVSAMSELLYDQTESISKDGSGNMLSDNEIDELKDHPSDIDENTKCVRNIVYFALPPKQYLPPLRAIKEIRSLMKRPVVKSSKISSENIHENIEEYSAEKNQPFLSSTKNQETGHARFTNAVKIDRNKNDVLDIILEKPIGYDLKTSREILNLANEAVDGCDDSVWCVDHYVAKDLAAVILPLKTSQIPSLSSLFQKYFNSNYISKIDFTFSDTNILDGRSGYFDGCGIVRDIIQNHLIQLLTLTCADVSKIIETQKLNNINDNISSSDNDKNKINTNNDKNDHLYYDNDKKVAPGSYDAMGDTVRSEHISNMRLKVLHSIRPLNHSDIVVGQYDSYVTERGVKLESTTSTFSSCKIQIPGSTWGNTSFHLTAGKGLDRKESVIRIAYKPEHFSKIRTAVHEIQKMTGISVFSELNEIDTDITKLKSVVLILQIQPQPGLYIEEEMYEKDYFNEQNNREKRKTVISKKLVLSVDDMPTWDNPNSPISAKIRKNLTQDDSLSVKSVGEINGNEAKTVNSDWTMEAYTRVIHSILFRHRKREYFPSINEVEMQWKIFDEALSKIENTFEARIGQKNARIFESKKVRKEEKIISSNIDKMFENGAAICLEDRVVVETSPTYVNDVLNEDIELRMYGVGSSIESIVDR